MSIFLRFTKCHKRPFGFFQIYVVAEEFCKLFRGRLKIYLQRILILISQATYSIDYAFYTTTFSENKRG